jgi:transcriptional regulator with GAF, ATPase, and Fis domain
MAPREQVFPNSVGPGARASSAQPFLSLKRRPRDEAALLHALTRALAVLVRSGPHERALRESFVDAMTGLGAEKGLLIQVRQAQPLEIAILHAGGVTVETEQACLALRSSPGISPTLIRSVIEDGQARLLENSAVVALDRTASLCGQPFSVLCAPVADSLTGSVVAVLYFLNDAARPFDAEDLDWVGAYAAALGQALTLHLAGQRRIRELEAEWRRTQDAHGPEIVGESEATRQLVEELNVLLPSTARKDAPPILVAGESGVGKELVARYLHHYSPRRNRGPFAAFNCAALRGDLAESKLFGHVRGAFTGAFADSPGLFRAASGGVLLLDEIGELSPEGQALLLRVLETRAVQPVGETRAFPVDVQIVLATNRKLEAEVAARRFREDLYYRVSALVLELLPLRDPRRVADVAPLLAHYIAMHERALKKKTRGLTRDALVALRRFAWPGNVRQLSNVCLCLVTHAQAGAWIDLPDLERLQPEVLAGPPSARPDGGAEGENVTYGLALRAFRRNLVLGALRRHGGRVTEAAASLGISGPTFYRYWSDARRSS